MKVFVNKTSGIKWLALEMYVKEGADSWYITSANTSLPKKDWEVQEDGKVR